jgi:hypothetical protein
MVEVALPTRETEEQQGARDEHQTDEYL